MVRTIFIIALIFSLAVLMTEGCQSGGGNPPFAQKDLSQQMDVLSIYQNQMGDDIRHNDLKGAKMMLDGMDSVFREIIATINRHPKLNNPFSYYYDSKLDEPISSLRRAIRSGDEEKAIQHYKFLVKRCNSCHNVHDVEERAHE